MRSVGTSLHAVVMRGVWASVPSWVTPGRSAPPPAAQVPRSFGPWSFPSLMGFRRLPFPNHACLPVLSQLCQRREISSWLARWFPKDPAKPVVAQKTPIRLELVAGKTYRWCVCGRSKKQPFCDGSHFFQRTGLSPLKFKAQETRTVALCTCKATRRPPYCDGTHKSEQLPFREGCNAEPFTVGTIQGGPYLPVGDWRPYPEKPVFSWWAAESRPCFCVW